MHTTLSSAAANGAGSVATAAGAVQLIGLASLIAFFIVGEPFGTVNDICIALAGLLSAALAWQLLAVHPAETSALGWLALGTAVVGALIVVLGSALVIFRVTGFTLAGFYMEVGNALIGSSSQFELRPNSCGAGVGCFS